MFNKALLMTTLLILTTSVNAEGFYAGAGVGLTQIEDSEQGLSFEDSPFGFRLFAGYDFSEAFSVEGAYVNSGEASDTIQGERVDVELSAVTLSLLGHLQLSDAAGLFGKLGYFSGDQEASAFGMTVEEDDDGITAGAGVRFDLRDNFSIRGDIDWYDSNIDTLWSAGVGFQFMFGD